MRALHVHAQVYPLHDDGREPRDGLSRQPRPRGSQRRTRLAPAGRAEPRGVGQHERRQLRRVRRAHCSALRRHRQRKRPILVQFRRGRRPRGVHFVRERLAHRIAAIRVVKTRPRRREQDGNAVDRRQLASNDVRPPASEIYLGETKLVLADLCGVGRWAPPSFQRRRINDKRTSSRTSRRYTTQLKEEGDYNVSLGMRQHLEPLLHA